MTRTGTPSPPRLCKARSAIIDKVCLFDAGYLFQSGDATDTDQTFVLKDRFVLSLLRAVTAVAFLVHSTLGCGLLGCTLLHEGGCGAAADATCEHAAESIGHGHDEACSGHGVDDDSRVAHVRIAPPCSCHSAPDHDRHGSHGLACEFVFVSPEHSHVIALPIVSVHELAWQPASETGDHVVSMTTLANRRHAFSSSSLDSAARCAVLCIWRI